jgi:hypothetical protein
LTRSSPETVAFHGIAHTHLDSLAHVNYDGKFYNGYTPQLDVVMKEGGHATSKRWPPRRRRGTGGSSC